MFLQLAGDGRLGHPESRGHVGLIVILIQHLGENTQLDLIKGRRTDGRVTTQERVFATLRHFTLGVNGEGMIAPYMVGFSTMGTVRGADGEPLPGLDQALPETAAGMSGMSIVQLASCWVVPSTSPKPAIIWMRGLPSCERVAVAVERVRPGLRISAVISAG